MTNLISWSSINLGTCRGSTFLKSLLPKERRVEKIPKNCSIDILVLLIDISDVKVKEKTIMVHGKDKTESLNVEKSLVDRELLNAVEKLLVDRKLLEDRQSIVDCVKKRMSEIRFKESVTIVFNERDQSSKSGAKNLLSGVKLASYEYHEVQCRDNGDGTVTCYPI